MTGPCLCGDPGCGRCFAQPIRKQRTVPICVLCEGEGDSLDVYVPVPAVGLFSGRRFRNDRWTGFRGYLCIAHSENDQLEVKLVRRVGVR